MCLSLAGNAKWLVRIGDQKKGPMDWGPQAERSRALSWNHSLPRRLFFQMKLGKGGKILLRHEETEKVV